MGSPTATYLMWMPNGSNPAYEGNEAMLIGNQWLGGFVTQTVSTEVGKRYRLSLAVIEIEGNVGQVRATASSATKVDLVGLFAAPGANDWSTTDYEFVASGATTTVKIENVPGAACAIDAVVLEATNLLDDGGFELGLTKGPNTFTNLTDGTVHGAWTAVGDPTVLGMPFEPSPGFELPVYEGVEAMNLGVVDPTAGVQQTFATTPGRKCYLSLAVIGYQGAVGTVRARVFNTTQTDLQQNFVAPGADKWAVASYEFTASGTTTTLEIRNTAGGCTIDDVRVSTTPLDMGLEFDGVDDYATLGSGVNLANKSFTIEFWAKRGDSNTGQQYMVSQGTSGNNINLHIGFVNNQVKFAFYNNDTLTPQTFPARPGTTLPSPMTPPPILAGYCATAWRCTTIPSSRIKVQASCILVKI